MEAQKLRKKLNGSTLKGAKMSVEEARPVRKRKSDLEGEEGESDKKRVKREKRDSKRERQDGVLAGHELENGRRVKRGWTGDDAREKKKKGEKQKNARRQKAADPSERKLRFKTTVPSNKAPLAGEGEKKKKDKKDKKAKDKGQTVVEEFTKRRRSRKDDAVADGVDPGSTKYVDGKGWVDAAGNVIEPERRSTRRKKKPSPSPPPEPPPAADATSAGAEVSESKGEANGVRQETGAEPQGSVLAASSSSTDDSESEDEDEQVSPSDTTPPADQPQGVHPLEALFKRPAPAPNATTTQNVASPTTTTTPNKPRPAPIDTSFSFFGGGGDGDIDMEGDDADAGAGTGSGALPPVTPHTKQDLEWRSLRSAAPTPDTAAIGRKFSFPFAGGDLSKDEEEEDDGEGGEVEAVVREDGAMDDDETPGKGGAGGEGGEWGEESAFRKWFFENRGDLNRGWKKRRREERKVKRQRENRRVGRKVA